MSASIPLYNFEFPITNYKKQTEEPMLGTVAHASPPGR